MENTITGQFQIKNTSPEPILPSDIPNGDLKGTPLTPKLNIFGGGADPITAGFNAAAAFFQFLCTVQGQRVCNDMLTIDEELVKRMHELFIKIHDFIEKKA